MQRPSNVEWWKRRRVIWPIGTLLFLVVAAGLAVTRSNTSLVVVYNETGARISELTVTACGQSKSFHDVNEFESVRFRLSPTGSESDVCVLTNGVVLWRGEYIEPTGSHRTLVHLRRGGMVEAVTTISWLQNTVRRGLTSSF